MPLACICDAVLVSSLVVKDRIVEDGNELISIVWELLGSFEENNRYEYYEITDTLEKTLKDLR